MQYNERTNSQYVIVFGESKHEHWFIQLLQPPFQHVLAVRDDGDYWTIINPLCSHIDTQVVTKDRTIEQMFPNSVQLSYNAILDQQHMSWSLGICSCVDIVKRVLGIRAFWVWTPRQLYKRLSQ